MSHKTLDVSWKTPVDESLVTQSRLQEDFLSAPKSPKTLLRFNKCQKDLVIGRQTVDLKMNHKTLISLGKLM